MKRIIFLLFAVSLLTFACKKNLKKEIIGKWKVTSVDSKSIDSASKNFLDQIKSNEKGIELVFENDSILNIITPDGKFKASYILEKDSTILYQINGLDNEEVLGKFDGDNIIKDENFQNNAITATIKYSKSK
ncbi:MAG: hypothetical protein ACEPOW_05945 [Bacteroidales bacterium]